MSMSDFPPWLVEAMQREGERMAPKPIALPERNFAAHLPGVSISGIQKIDRGWYFTADMDTATPMECWVFTSPVDMAASLRNITELNIDATTKVHGDLVDRAIFHLDSGVIDDAPYIAIETLFAMEAPDEPRTGFVKARIARRDDVHIACSHNQIGFRQTFAENFAQFVESAKFELRALQPFYRQVYRQSIDGVGIGIIENLMAIDGDGDLALIARYSTLVPQSPDMQVANDSFEYGFWTTEFELINQREIGSTNGTVTYNLNLQPGSENRYRVVGTTGEQEIDFEIEDEVGPMSGYERMLEIQRLIRDPGRTSLTTRMWRVEIDPNRMIETTVSFNAEGKERLMATMTNGSESVPVQLDRFGNIVTMQYDVELGSYAIERIYDEGQAPSLADAE